MIEVFVRLWRNLCAMHEERNDGILKGTNFNQRISSYGE